MGRFYFHLREGGELIIDEDGEDLSDEVAARRAAEKAAREILTEAIRVGERAPDAFVITDEQGREVDIVRLADVLPKNLR